MTRRVPHIVYLESVTGYSDAENMRRLQLLRSSLRPGFTIELLTTPGGPAILERPQDFEQAGRAASAAVAVPGDYFGGCRGSGTRRAARDRRGTGRRPR